MKNAFYYAFFCNFHKDKNKTLWKVQKNIPMVKLL